MARVSLDVHVGSEEGGIQNDETLIKLQALTISSDAQDAAGSAGGEGANHE